MAKTNFSKTESALDEMLQKMTKEKLLEMADEAKGIEKPQISDKEKILQVLQLELRYLYRNHKEIYKKLNIDKKELKKNLENEGEWNKILALKKTVDEIFIHLFL